MKYCFSLLFPCSFSANVTTTALSLLLLFAVLIGSLSGQNRACEKNCLDPEGPCSDKKGKDFAQCLGQCQQSCKPHPPPPPPLLEPGCGDRSIQGKIRCTIAQPNVNVDHINYQSEIRFAPGDIVEVRADGCVQTGGHGNSWKRYVNPSGDSNGTNYHGLMQIPTAFPAGGGLIPIKDFIGKLQMVRGDPNVPVSDLYLHLGYHDSDYSDNGYNDRDDGTNAQCSLSNIGYPASVTIIIYRGVPPDPPQNRFDFDLIPNLVVHSVVTDKGVNNDPDHLGMDHNGLLLNPTWSFHAHPKNYLHPEEGTNAGLDPSGDLCHDFSYRPDIIGIPTPHLEPYFADCTDQTDENNTDMASGEIGVMCYLGKHGPFETGSFPGHVNWFPITMTGRAKWGNHEDVFPFGDDDYNFNFFPDSPGNSLILAGRDALHAEFDSDETIDNFGSKAWIDLHNAVNAADDAKAALTICVQKHNCTDARMAQLDATIHAGPAKFFDGPTILTGMFGVDGEHDLKVELHPIFALATQLESHSDPLDEVWLMFARDRGDEGYCSSQLWESRLENYIVRLPWRDGATSVQVTQRDFHGPEGFTPPEFMIVPPGSKDDAGVYATFHLGPAEFGPLIDGSVHLSWIGTAGGQRMHPFPSGTVTTTTGTLTQTPAKPDTGAKGPAKKSAATASTTKKSAPPQAATKAGTNPKLEEADEIGTVFQTTVSKLTPEQLQEIQKAHPHLVPRPTHQLSPGKIETVSSVPLNFYPVQVWTYKAGPATIKNERDAAGVHALCTATHNAPPGLPADLCSKATLNQPPSNPPVRK